MCNKLMFDLVKCIPLSLIARPEDEEITTHVLLQLSPRASVARARQNSAYTKISAPGQSSSKLQV